MSCSTKSNLLEARNRVDDHFVALLTRSLLHSENHNTVIVLVTTLIMITTISIVVQRLNRFRRVDRPALFEQHKKENSDTSTLLKYESTMNYEKLLSELHSAADKCFIKKYTERCIKLINYCPLLINAKFGPTGLTPFHRVCFHGHASLIRFMLSRGANPHLISDAGENAICLAVYYYLNKCGDVDGKNMPCLDILQRAGCRLDGNNVWYDILLKMAIRSGKTSLIEWLLTNKQTPRSNRLERCNSHSLSF